MAVLLDTLFDNERALRSICAVKASKTVSNNALRSLGKVSCPKRENFEKTSQLGWIERHNLNKELLITINRSPTVAAGGRLALVGVARTRVRLRIGRTASQLVQVGPPDQVLSSPFRASTLLFSTGADKRYK